jgi:hypothetical protein
MKQTGAHAPRQSVPAPARGQRERREARALRAKRGASGAAPAPPAPPPPPRMAPARGRGAIAAAASAAAGLLLGLLLLLLLPSTAGAGAAGVPHAAGRGGGDAPVRPGPQPAAAAAAAAVAPPPPPQPPARRALQQRARGEQEAAVARARARRRRARARRKLEFDAFIRAARDAVPARDEAEGCGERVGVGYLERWRKLGGMFCAPTPAGGSGGGGGRGEEGEGEGGGDDGEGGGAQEEEGEEGSGGGNAPARPPRRGGPGSELPAAAAGHPPGRAPPRGSSVRCNAHPAADLTTCLATNLVLDAAAFVGRGGAAGGLPGAARGSVRLGCIATEPVAGYLRGRLKNEGPRRWLVNAAAHVPPAAVDAACGGPRAVRHAVVLLTRVDGANAFHNAGARPRPGPPDCPAPAPPWTAPLRTARPGSGHALQPDPNHPRPSPPPETLVHLFLGLATLQVPPDMLEEGLQVSAPRRGAGPQLCGHRAWLRAPGRCIRSRAGAPCAVPNSCPPPPAPPPRRRQVMVADHLPPGPFLDILRRLSHPHPLVLLRAAPPPDGTCLRAAVIGACWRAPGG